MAVWNSQISSRINMHRVRGLMAGDTAEVECWYGSNES